MREKDFPLETQKSPSQAERPPPAGCREGWFLPLRASVYPGTQPAWSSLSSLTFFVSQSPFDSLMKDTCELSHFSHV